MKASFVFCLVFTILCGVSCEIFQMNVKPVLATNLVIPVGYNTVSVQMPYCYFKSIAPIFCVAKYYSVWLVCSLTSAKSNYEMNKETDFRSKYPEAFTSQGQKYFTVGISYVEDLPCPAELPYHYLVGAEGVCTEDFCNGVFPEGENISCKYSLADYNGKMYAETQWSDNIHLRYRNNHEDLANKYGGLSTEMIVITSILGACAAFLLLFLLTVMIYSSCHGKRKTQSIQRSSTSGSLLIPSYNSHLINSSLQDNPAYEQKKRYTTNSTKSQKNTTDFIRTQSSSLNNTALQEK